MSSGRALMRTTEGLPSPAAAPASGSGATTRCCRKRLFRHTPTTPRNMTAARQPPSTAAVDKVCKLVTLSPVSWTRLPMTCMAGQHRCCRRDGIPWVLALQVSLTITIPQSPRPETAHMTMNGNAAKHTDDRDAARSCQVGRLLLEVLVLLQRPAVAEEAVRCCQLLESQGHRCMRSQKSHDWPVVPCLRM